MTIPPQPTLSYPPFTDIFIIQCLAQGVLTTRHKTLSPSPTGTKKEVFIPRPALKICLTTGLSKKEVEKAGITIRHAITKVMTRKR
jgi:hypothetical protein